MIRRTTPNKTFSSSRGGSSCCRWNRDEETKVQQKVLLTKKKTPLKLTQTYKSNTISTACHQEDHKTDHAELVPRKFHSFNRNLSNSTKVHFSTAFKSLTMQTRDTPRSLTQTPLPQNPLQRLHKRLKAKCYGNNSVARRLSWGTPNTTVTFSHLISVKQDLNPEELSLLTEFAHAKELQAFEYQKLKQEIKKYKAEYRSLLQEQDNLKSQRQKNKELYEALLTDLYQKQKEMREADKMRRLELQELKGQIEMLLASKEQRMGVE